MSARLLLPPLSGVAAVLALGAAPAVAGGITVDVGGIANDQGNIRVAVCSKEEFLKPKCSFVAAAPAKPGTVQLVVPDVPPGIYAVQAYHDENENAKIDRSFFGAPSEGVGFSNGAPMLFGPPDFAEAAVEVGESEAFTVVPLKYF